MTFVILQAPNEGYYWLIKATSDKHFELVDKGFQEIDSGEYYDMLESLNILQYDPSLIHLKCVKFGTMIQTTEDCLHRILAINPDYLTDKEFV